MFTVNENYKMEYSKNNSISKHFMFTVNWLISIKGPNTNLISKHFMFTVNPVTVGTSFLSLSYFKTFHVYG